MCLCDRVRQIKACRWCSKYQTIRLGSNNPRWSQITDPRDESKAIFVPDLSLVSIDCAPILSNLLSEVTLYLGTWHNVSGSAVAQCSGIHNHEQWCQSDWLIWFMEMEKNLPITYISVFFKLDGTYIDVSQETWYNSESTQIGGWNKMLIAHWGQFSCQEFNW